MGKLDPPPAAPSTEGGARAPIAGKRLAAALAVVVAATLLARAPTLRVPLDQDGAVFCYCATTWAEGGLPYRDAWDHKLPLTYVVYRALFAVAPPSAVPVNLTLRVGSALCDALTAVVLLFLARRFLGGPAGLLAGLLYGVFTGAPILQIESFQPERVSVLFTAAGVLAAAAYAESRRYRLAALSGLLFGLAIVAKQTAAPVGVVAWAWLTWDALRASGRQALRRVAVHSALLAVGAAVPFALFAGYFALRGAFHDFWACTYDYNVLYAAQQRKGGVVQSAVRLVKGMVFDHGFLWVLCAGGVVAALLRRAERRAGLLVALWAVAAFVAVALPGQFSHYYYIPAVAPVAVGAAAGLVGLWGFARRSGARAAAAGVLALVLVAMLGLAAKRAWAVYRTVTDAASTNVVVEDLARELADATTPDQRLYVWGSRPQLYVLSGRRNVCRYLFNFSFGISLDQAFLFQEPVRREIMDGLRRHQPPFLITTETETLSGFPELKQYLGEHYKLERQWPARPYSLTVYRRRGA